MGAIDEVDGVPVLGDLEHQVHLLGEHHVLGHRLLLDDQMVRCSFEDDARAHAGHEPGNLLIVGQDRQRHTGRLGNVEPCHD